MLPILYLHLEAKWIFDIFQKNKPAAQAAGADFTYMT